MGRLEIGRVNKRNKEMMELEEELENCADIGPNFGTFYSLLF